MATKKPELKVVPVKKGKTTKAVKQPKDKDAIIQEQMDVLLKQRNHLLHLVDELWNYGYYSMAISEWAEDATVPDSRGFCGGWSDCYIQYVIYLRSEIREAKEYIDKSEARKYW